MNDLHSLLRRQLKQHFTSDFDIPEDWQAFISSINEAYWQSDNDRNMVARSLDFSSKELLEANTQLRAVFQAIPDLFFWLDQSGKILDCKAGMDMDLYIPREQLIGRMIQNVPGLGADQKFATALNQVNDTKAVVSMEYSLFINGSENFYEARLVPLLEDKRITIIRNITERNRAERALLESEQKYRHYIESASDVFLIVDINTGIILEANNKAESMFKRPAVELIGMHYSQLHPPADRAKYELLFHDSASQGRSTINRLEVMDKHGCKIPVEISTSVTEIAGQQLMLGIFRDISRNLQDEMEREAIRACATQLISMMSLDDIFRLIPSNIALNLQCSGVGIQSYDEKTKMMVTDGQVGLTEANSGIPIEEAISWRAISTGEAIVESHVSQRRDPLYAPLIERNIETYICVPMKINDTFTRVLCLEDKVSRTPESLLQTMQIIADNLALIIERMEAEKEVQNKARELESAAQELQERTDKLERFQRLTVGREFDMIDLKHEINQLRTELGLPKKYAVPDQVTQLRARRNEGSA